MRLKRNKGSITVFLAITFIFIMAMLGTLIDGARLVEAHSQMYYAADLAATSALAGFDYKLKDRYGLFAYEGSPNDVLEYVVKQNLNSDQNSDLSESEEWYQYIYDVVLGAINIEDASRNKPFDLLQFYDIKVSQSGEPITLHDPDEFERQVFEYVKFRGPVELLFGDMSINFGEIDEELEKAGNEDEIDKEMQELEEMLAEHIEAKGKYNEDMKVFRQKMADISDDYYDPITVELNETPSLGGLGSLKGMMGSLSGALSVESDCDDLRGQINDLEDSYDDIVQAADDLEHRFTGSGVSAAFDGKPISGEMLENYKKDLEDIKARAELDWGSSTTSDEIQKYNSIESAAAEIKSRISDYRHKITELQLKAEDPDYDEEGFSISEEVENLWIELDSHFNGMLYYGGISGVFYNAEILRELLPYTESASDENEVEEWSEKAKEELGKSGGRNYNKKIPDGYTLPSNISAESVTEKLLTEIESDFKSKDMDAVKEKREDNQKSTAEIKDLFKEVGNLTLDTLDSAMLGLYAIGNFENTLCSKGEKPSGYMHTDIDTTKYSLNMRNDPIVSFFDDCEIEYLIKGNPEEKKNYQSIRNELTGLYFTLNYAFVRRPNEIRIVVEAIAHAVELAILGATLGIGAGAARIAYYATREACYMALAAIQTSHDLDRLYRGDKAPLLKKDVGDFCGVTNMVGMGGVHCTDNAPGSKLPIGYMDYLFIRMITTGHGKLLKRLQNLVDLNMNNGNVNRPFKLENMRTSVSVKTEATMPFFFINVMFMAENFDGSGIKVTKYASQKY